jgi:uncharacterized damage-inducible protein DinB
MNAHDILKYGHQTVLDVLEGVPSTEWETPNVCGVWSVRQIIAHLASFEQVLAEVLGSFLGGGSTPNLDQFVDLGAAFNDVQVPQRDTMTPEEVVDEYTTMHEHNTRLAREIPAERFPETGTLPWYGMEYALDDFIVYMYYGHKREHSAQIAVFLDFLKGVSPPPRGGTVNASLLT